MIDWKRKDKIWDLVGNSETWSRRLGQRKKGKWRWNTNYIQRGKNHMISNYIPRKVWKKSKI